MIRAVLVRQGDDDWRLYRQPQWMALVRRDPAASQWPRHHFDLGEQAFEAALAAWDAEGAASGLDEARRLLDRLGAIEIIRP